MRDRAEIENAADTLARHIVLMGAETQYGILGAIAREALQWALGADNSFATLLADMKAQHAVADKGIKAVLN